MSYCINPYCPKPSSPLNTNNAFCSLCGTELLLQGRYRVISLLSNDSGFGDVYQAEEVNGERKIIKVLKQNLNAQSKAVELFQNEAEVLSQLNHPGIPQVEANGYFTFFPKNSQEALHCFAMEYIEGIDLEKWMNNRDNQPITEEEAIAWLKQITQILEQVHQQDYFHRDIKPSNIMLANNEHLVLIDFGTAREITGTYLAKISGKNVTKLASAGYTPPEQEKGHAVPQSDFYALGRTFVYLLTGKSPSDNEIYDPMNDELRWRNFAPHVSSSLTDFIDNLMSQKASDRPQNTLKILENLENLKSYSSIGISQNQPNTSTNLNPASILTFVSWTFLLAIIGFQGFTNSDVPVPPVPNPDRVNTVANPLISFVGHITSFVGHITNILFSTMGVSLTVILGIVATLIAVIGLPIIGWGMGLLIIVGLVLIIPIWFIFKIAELFS
jgi:serine/threonine protein kinase